TDDPAGGGELSRSLEAYEFLVGYNVRLGTGAWSPKVELLGGYSTYRLFSDKSSAAAVTTKSYGGMKLGVAGFYPLKEESDYALGPKLFLFFNPKLSEEPSYSGGGDHTIRHFSLFVDKKLRINLKARFALDFELYTSDYNGVNVISASQRHTALSG